MAVKVIVTYELRVGLGVYNCSTELGSMELADKWIAMASKDKRKSNFRKIKKNYKTLERVKR